MKCPKCGCENDEKYAFCKECGEPLEKTSKITDKTNSGDKKSPLSKKGLLIGIGVIAVIALLAIGLNSLGIGSVEPGNEAIISIDQDSWDTGTDGEIYYSLSFVLTNAPREANSYYAKLTFYNDAGEVIMSNSEDLEYSTINDDHTMDIIAGASHTPVDISNVVIEITNNQGELVTSADYKWIS